MAKQFRIFFDDVEIQKEPAGLASFEITIERDDVLRGLFRTFSSELIFIGDAYDILFNQFQFEGYCTDINVEIQERCEEVSDSGNLNDYTTLFEGIIFLRDVKFNLSRCTATTKILDNSYFAKIDSNQKQKTFLSVGRSKNDVDISAFVVKTSLILFNTAGLFSFPGREAYHVLDVFRFQVIVFFLISKEL